ncbi:MAG: zinc ribbon domain-containing protein [Acidobacteria bacterium]|nr:zinc ribbon domain-containing protein [Acidobacteriota bacterium]MCI0628579.1 zinc ribbon domain-containing protein [Acidobacteriota bacterium]MCI0722462.1 zinc ribbon domain-containing protein [Acidobacteriota bacterium]
MFCTNCGKKNDDDSKFCIWCMREVQQRAIFPYKFRKLALIAWVVTALGVGGKTIVDVNRAMDRSVPKVRHRNEMPIVEDQFTVAKGNYWHQRFDILKGWKDVRILGKFTAAGATPDGVDMFLANEEGFERFISNRAHPTLCGSGRTTSGTINQLLDPGSYYVVVDNTFSSASDKAVNASLKVEYTIN